MRDLRFKFTLRSLLRNRNYTLLNVSGLAIGLAVSIVVYLYVQDELNYDEHFPGFRKIYRVNAQFELDAQSEQVAGNQPWSWTASGQRLSLYQKFHPLFTL